MAIIKKSCAAILFFTLLCGVCYTVLVTIFCQGVLPQQATGSRLAQNGRICGSRLLEQPFEQAGYLHGRPMAVTKVVLVDNGQKEALLYGVPSNLSPASSNYQMLIKQRIAQVHTANPMQKAAIPVDLVTSSGSGLDPQISLAAALYQVPRIAKADNLSKEQVTQLIKQETQHHFMGLWGENTVNVLAVNLRLQKLLE